MALVTERLQTVLVSCLRYYGKRSLKDAIARQG